MTEEDPPEIPGIIEGSITIHPGQGGSVSFRVVIGVDDRQAARHDLLELIFGAEHSEELSRALTRRNAKGSTSDPISLPCHIGFRRSAARVFS